jgi:hypothetical protein
MMDPTYEDGGIYIILTTIGIDRWHWGIYVSVSDTYGMFYHVTNRKGQWVFQDQMTENVVDHLNIIAALQIGGSIEEQWAEAVHNILIAVPVIAEGGLDPRWGQNFTCRVWVLEAVDRLRLANLVPDEPSLEVEEDAFNAARAASSSGTRRMVMSRGVKAQRLRN